MPKAGSDYTCLAVINVDSALKKKDDTYYLQVFFKKCKYIKKTLLGIILEIRKFLSICLMKNNFSFNERFKKFHKHNQFLICKLLISLDYLYTLDYKEVLLTTLSITYTDHQKLWLLKLLPSLRVLLMTLSTCSIAYRRLFVWSTKNFSLEEMHS